MWQATQLAPSQLNSAKCPPYPDLLSSLPLRQLGSADALTTKWALLVRFISHLWQALMDPAHLIRNGPARPSRARELVTSRRARARACSTATVSSRASGSTLGHRMLVRPAGHRNRVLVRPRLERSPPGRRALAWPHAIACSRGRGRWLEQSSGCIQMKRSFQLGC